MPETTEKRKLRIYDINGKKAVLDADLANALGYTTKALNQAYQRHLSSFPQGSLFILEFDEAKRLIDDDTQGFVEIPSSFVTSSDNSVTSSEGFVTSTHTGKTSRLENKHPCRFYAAETIGILPSILRKKGVDVLCDAIEKAIACPVIVISEKPAAIEINEDWIRSKIYQIRGTFVMLDEDLAKVYGYPIKNFTRQIKNNMDRFDPDFMFRLTESEAKTNLRYKNCTSSWGGRRYLPFAFTELGIYMLPSVLKGELAAKQCKAIVRAFYGLKHRFSTSRAPIISIHEFDELRDRVTKNEESIHSISADIKDIKGQLKEPNSTKYFIIRNGERVLADEVYASIYARAKKSIVVIDDYIGRRSLLQMKSCPIGTRITFVSENKASDGLTQAMLDSFRKDRPDLALTFLRSNKSIHDRLIAIDIESKKRFLLFHCGGSSKNAGEKTTFIQELPMPERYKDIIVEALESPPLQLP